MKLATTVGIVEYLTDGCYAFEYIRVGEAVLTIAICQFDFESQHLYKVPNANLVRRLWIYAMLPTEVLRVASVQIWRTASIREGPAHPSPTSVGVSRAHGSPGVGVHCEGRRRSDQSVFAHLCGRVWVRQFGDQRPGTRFQILNDALQTLKGWHAVDPN